MSVSLLVDDVWGHILSSVRARDRFGRFALASRECHRLAFSCPLFSLSLFMIPRFVGRYEILLNDINFWVQNATFTDDKADLERQAREVVRACVDELFSSSYFLSHAPLASVRVLEMTWLEIPAFFIEGVSHYFPSAHYISVSLYSDRVSLGQCSNQMAVEALCRNGFPLSSFPNLKGLSLRVLSNYDLIIGSTHQLRYLKLEFAPEGIRPGSKPFLESSPHLQTLHLPRLGFSLDLTKFPMLTDLKLANISDPHLFDGFTGQHLKKLAFSIKNPNAFPDLNILASSLEELIILEPEDIDGVPFAIPRGRIARLNLQKLALLGSDMTLSLDAFVTQSSITDLSINARLLDDHFTDKFFGALKSFTNLTSLSLLGPLPMFPLKKALVFLPHLKKFAFDDNSPRAFQTLNEITIPRLWEGLPEGLEELRLNLKNDLYHETTRLKFENLRVLRIQCPISSVEGSLNHIGRLKNLEHLEIWNNSNTEPIGAFSLEDIQSLLTSLPSLSRLYLTGVTASWSRDRSLLDACITQFLCLEIFETSPLEEPTFHPDYVEVYAEEMHELDDEWSDYS